jgi:hypothetical protein
VTAKQVSYDEVRFEKSNDKNADELVPNGRAFVVKYPKVREKLVNMRTFVAVGRYSGRTGENNVPVLSASLVMARGPGEHSGNAP